MFNKNPKCIRTPFFHVTSMFLIFLEGERNFSDTNNLIVQGIPNFQLQRQEIWPLKGLAMLHERGSVVFIVSLTVPTTDRRCSKTGTAQRVRKEVSQGEVVLQQS